MKLFRFILLFLLIYNTFSCFAQYRNQSFIYAWMVTKTVNSIGMAIQNDLPFCIISFSPKNRADIFLYFIINGQEQHDVEYELNDSVLIINDYYEKYKFKIIEKTDRQIIINKNDKNYYLKRLLKYENNNFILSDDTVSFNQSKIDTIKTY